MLSDVQERVEKSIYEAIRLKLVAEGYLPNIRNYSQNDAGALAYKNAIAAVVSSKGFCIEIFGMSSPQAKGELKVPRIIVQTQRALMGDVGTPLTSKIVNGDHYEVTKHPYSAVNMQVDIKVVWNTAKHNRVCNAVLAETLSTRNYLDYYDTPNNVNKFYLENLNTGYDVSNSEQGVTESMYFYQVKDLYIGSDQVIVNNGPLIKEISTQVLDPTNNIDLLENK